MKNMIKHKVPSKSILLALIASLAFSACSTVEPRHQGNVYGVNSMGQSQSITYAQIIDIQDAYVQSEGGNLLVAGLGAIAGGYIGKHIGGGSGQEIAKIFGALAGGYATNEAYRQYGSTSKVKQFTIRTQGGSTYSVLQADPQNQFRIGQTVKVTGSNGKVKILP